MMGKPKAGISSRGSFSGEPAVSFRECMGDGIDIYIYIYKCGFGIIDWRRSFFLGKCRLY